MSKVTDKILEKLVIFAGHFNRLNDEMASRTTLWPATHKWASQDRPASTCSDCLNIDVGLEPVQSQTAATYRGVWNQQSSVPVAEYVNEFYIVTAGQSFSEIWPMSWKVIYRKRPLRQVLVGLKCFANFAGSTVLVKIDPSCFPYRTWQ